MDILGCLGISSLQPISKFLSRYSLNICAFVYNGREDPLEKGMATHSNILAWRIPRTEEPGRLQSMQSQRVGHD